MGYIRTYTWRKMDPFDPDPSQIVIEDIAHALAHTCRFGGHASRFYSVAEHCVHVSDLLPLNLAFQGLMHDAPEAYLVDVPRPIKHFPGMQSYRDAEDNLLRIIAEIYGFAVPLPDEIWVVDDAMLHTEQPALFRGMKDLSTEGSPADVELVFWTPEEAKREFLDRFDTLSN